MGGTAIINRKLKELNEREQKFVDGFIETGNAFKAFENSGYACIGKGWRANARKKHQEMRLHIEQRMHLKICRHVPWAFNQMVDLAKNTKNDSLKFKILQDILARAGYDQPKIIEHRADDVKELNSKEIAEEIRGLIQATGNTPLKAVGDD